MAKRTIAAIPGRSDVTDRIASPWAMARASNQMNEARNKSQGYYYGNLGDSIERRFNGDFGQFLGGGSNYIGEGSMGTGSTYNAVGYGNFYGTGLGYGAGSRYGPWTAELGGGPFRYMRKYAGSATAFHSVIAQCMLVYQGHGIVRNVIDLYTDFASEGLKINHPDKTVQNFYNAWAKKVRLNDRISSIFMTLFTTGNVFVHRQWATLSDKDRDSLRRSNAKLIADEFYSSTKNQDRKLNIHPERQTSVISKKRMPSTEAASAETGEVVTERNRVPWGYTLLNPLQMTLKGRKFTNEHQWAIGLDREDLRDIGKEYGHTINIASTRVNIPKELKAALNERLEELQGPSSGFVAELALTDDSLSVIHGRKYDWWDWAIPFIFPALRAINFKDCLRNMEMRACESVINSIFLFKLGNIEKGMPAEEEHFERLADMLQQPGQALNILWNEAIEAEVITADVAKLFDPKKHESADRDILMSLGINESLIGGAGGRFSNSFIGAATVLERIETARGGIEEWLMQELKIVADAMGFRKLPTITWGKTSLRDVNAERALIIQLLDRGIISIDEALQEFGSTAEIQAAKRKEEEKFINDGTFKPRGPYTVPMDEANLDEDLPQPQNDPLALQKEAADNANKLAEKGLEQQAKMGDDKNNLEKEKMKQGQQAPGVPPGGPGQKPGPDGDKNGPKTGNGRPPNSKEPVKRGEQTNKRGPTGTGKNTAELLEVYEQIKLVGDQALRDIETHLSKKVLGLRRWSSKGLRHVKQLPQEERDRLEQLTFSVFSHMPPAPKHNAASDEFIVKLLESGASSGVKADVLATYQRKVANYEAQFGKEPSKEHRRQFIVSAWTQSAIDQQTLT